MEDSKADRLVGWGETLGAVFVASFVLGVILKILYLLGKLFLFGFIALLVITAFILVLAYISDLKKAKS